MDRSSSDRVHREFVNISKCVLRTYFVDQIEARLSQSGTFIPHVFSTAGHELAQAMVGCCIQSNDAVFSYYRSKGVWFAAGLKVEDYAASALQHPNSYAAGRNCSVLPYQSADQSRPLIAPVFGGVGSQFEPALGWARSVVQKGIADSLAFVFAGDGSVSTGGYWSAIREATALQLPLVIVIENNGQAISTAITTQIGGENITDLFGAFPGIRCLRFDGNDLANAGEIHLVIEQARSTQSPLLLEMKVERLAAHTGATSTEAQHKQSWMEQLRAKWHQHDFHEDFETLKERIEKEVEEAFEQSDPLASPLVERVCQSSPSPVAFQHPFQRNKISIGHAINAWLNSALASDPNVILMGEDIGAMGGVHGITKGLQAQHGKNRVIDSALNESCILGEALGYALNGFRPIVEIQFRKYLDPAMEQFHNIGWCEWLTSGTFRASIILRIPFGSRSPSDPWHSESNEAPILRAIGWNVVCPTTAGDAIQALALAYDSQKPTVILEHRDLYYSSLSRQVIAVPIPIDYGLTARTRLSGDQMTIISWGAMTYRVQQVVEQNHIAGCELIDLFWLRPWDQSMVLDSVRKTGRCLIVHEDRKFLGLGAELSATIHEQLGTLMKHPVIRLGASEHPIPIDPSQIEQAIPNQFQILSCIQELLRS